MSNPLTVLHTLPGERMGARVVQMSHSLHEFNIQYEFSRERDEWRFSTYEGGTKGWGRKAYSTLALARAAARRLRDRNN